MSETVDTVAFVRILWCSCRVSQCSGFSLERLCFWDKTYYILSPLLHLIAFQGKTYWLHIRAKHIMFTPPPPILMFYLFKTSNFYFSHFQHHAFLYRTPSAKEQLVHKFNRVSTQHHFLLSSLSKLFVTFKLKTYINVSEVCFCFCN